MNPQVGEIWVNKTEIFGTCTVLLLKETDRLNNWGMPQEITFYAYSLENSQYVDVIFTPNNRIYWTRIE